MTPDEALMDRPGGRPVADHEYGGEPPDADSVRLVAVPTVPVWLPGLATVTVVPPPPPTNPPLPVGVPRPVGPSQPTPAWHQTAVGQLPLLPVVTSYSKAVCAHG